MSSSGRYQSRVFNFFSRQNLRLRDQVGLVWRRASVVASWGAQILLYPIYLGFQSIRVVNRQLQQTVRQVWPRLRAARETLDHVAHPDQQPPTAITADTPILKTLQAMSDLGIALPATMIDGAPVLVASLPPGSAAIALPQDAAAVNEAGHPSTLVHPAGVGDAVVSSVPIRAIASDRLSRRLVLVAFSNDVLDVLSPKQQFRLNQRMVWELASYWRDRRQLQDLADHRPVLPLPLPADRVHLLPPVRAFRRVMAWMQLGPVAGAINLFQESALSLYFSEADLEEPSGEDEGDPWLALIEQMADSVDGMGDSVEAIALPNAPSAAILSASPSAAVAALPQSTVQTNASLSPPRSPSPARSAALTMAKPPARSSKPKFLSRRRKAGQPVWPSRPYPSPEAPLNHKADASRVEPHAAAKTGAPLESSAPSPLTSSEPTQTTAKALNEANYIETKATLIGYEKHPLERVLEWVDRGMVWIETQLDKFWAWIQERLKP